MERQEFDERFYLLTAGDRIAIEDYLSLPAFDDAVRQLAPAKNIKEVLDPGPATDGQERTRRPPARIGKKSQR